MRLALVGLCRRHARARRSAVCSLFAAECWHEEGDQQLGADAAEEAAEEKRRLRSAAESLRDIGKRKAWNSWAEKAISMASSMRGLKAAVAAIRNKGLRQGFTSWADAAADAIESLRKLKAAAVSMRTIGLRRCWNSWAEKGAFDSERDEGPQGVNVLAPCYRQAQGVELVGGDGVRAGRVAPQALRAAVASLINGELGGAVDQLCCGDDGRGRLNARGEGGRRGDPAARACGWASRAEQTRRRRPSRASESSRQRRRLCDRLACADA